MRIFALLAAAVFLAAALAPRPQAQSAPPSALLFADPGLLSAVSGFGRSLAGDYIWLKSHRIDETALGEKADAAVLERVTQAQIALDPHFTVPVHYAAGYLASVAQEPMRALKLLHLSQQHNRDRFDLLFHEAMIRLSYGVPDSGDRMMELAAKIEPMPEKTKMLGAIKVDDWFLEVLAYVRTREGRSELIADDLQRLLEQTTHPQRRERILKQLALIQAPPKRPQSGQSPL